MDTITVFKRQEIPDGSKVFAVWTDVNIEEFGEEIEKLNFPDIYAFGKDVQTGMVTGVTNFTKYTVVEGACLDVHFTCNL